MKINLRKYRVLLVPADATKVIKVGEVSISVGVGYEPIWKKTFGKKYQMLRLYNPAATIVVRGGKKVSELPYNNRAKTVMRRHLGIGIVDQVYGDAAIIWPLTDRDEQITLLYANELNKVGTLPPIPPEYDYDQWALDYYGNPYHY